MRQYWTRFTRSAWGSVVIGVVGLLLIGLVGGAVLLGLTRLTTPLLPLLFVFAVGVFLLVQQRWER